MGFAEFIIGPANGRTRWLSHPTRVQPGHRAHELQQGGTVMRNADRVKLLCGIAVAAIAMSAVPTDSQDGNSAPNPYRLDEGWAKQPMGRGNGSTIGLNVDRDGKSMWIYDRCGGNTCEGSKIAPLNKYDASGRVVASLAAGMTNFPHGLFVDKDGNVWITDGRADKDKKTGHTVMKL